MSAKTVQVLSHSLRAAGRQLRSLQVEEVMAGLGRVLDEWSDAGSAPRRRLHEALPPATGLSAPTVRAGLDLALADWNGAALESLVEREIGSRGALAARIPEGLTTVVHGGVIPMPAIVDLLAPLLLRSPVLSRPGRHDRVTPGQIAESVARHAPALAGAIAVLEVPRDDEAGWRALLSSERVCITGGDAAVAALRERLGAGTRLIAHGHKLSVALLGTHDDADLAGYADRLAIDVALWDQLGCLSPVACWVIGRLDRARHFAEELARALAASEREWPRGAVGPAAAAAIAHERAEAELRAAAGRAVVLHAGDSWTVIAEPDAAPRTSPLHRFVRVHPVADAPSARAALGPLAGRVAGIACEGLTESDALGICAGLGATRVAPFGRLQAPPLDWARDGLGVLASLLGPDS